MISGSPWRWEIIFFSLGLALEKPGLLAALVASYDEYARANGIIKEPSGITAYPYKPGHLEDLVIDD